MDDYEEKRGLFLRAVRFAYDQGGWVAVDALVDPDPEALDLAWLYGDPEAFRELLRTRVRAALKKAAA